MKIVDWIWWGFGGALALLGVWLLWRALLADRARGRRRCPRCWYDLSATEGRRCPECGYEARSERKLFRTRRRWRLAALSLPVFLLSAGSFFGQQVHRKGWVSATPTLAYIAALPWLDRNTTFAELASRVEAGVLHQWEYRLLVHRAIGVLNDHGHDPQFLCELAHLLSRIEIGGRNIRDDQPWASWALVSDIDHLGAIEALVGLLDHPDKQVRIAALHALGQFTTKATPALPALLGQLSSDDQQIRGQASTALLFLAHSSPHAIHFPADLAYRIPSRARTEYELDPDFLHAMKKCGTDLAQARIALVAGLTSENAMVRATSVFGLALLYPGDPEVQQRILAMAEDEDQKVQHAVIGATTIFPLDDRVLRILETGLSSDYHRWTALNAIERQAGECRSLLPQVRSIMETMETRRDYTLNKAATCFVRLGGEPEIAVDVLLDRIASSDGQRPSPWSEKARLLDSLGELEVNSPKACEAIRPLVDSKDPDIQSAAAVAYVKLGGEDLDAATTAIFNALHTDKTQRGSMTFSRWFRFARHGRISMHVMRSNACAHASKRSCQRGAFSGRSRRPRRARPARDAQAAGRSRPQCSRLGRACRQARRIPARASGRAAEMSAQATTISVLKLPQACSRSFRPDRGH